MSLASLALVASAEKHKYEKLVQCSIFEFYNQILDQSMGRETWDVLIPQRYAHRIEYLLNFDYIVVHFGKVWRITKR